jgi:hypothetical protein
MTKTERRPVTLHLQGGYAAGVQTSLATGARYDPALFPPDEMIADLHTIFQQLRTPATAHHFSGRNHS